MTTAHRPTWAPAKGGDNEGGFKSYAGTRMTRVKDLNAGGDLKLRHDLDADGDPADLRAALEARERKALALEAVEKSLAPELEEASRPKISQDLYRSPQISTEFALHSVVPAPTLSRMTQLCRICGNSYANPS